ncbi:acyl CoA:acetate/3-ketoacid CoA transferase [Desulfosporosinus youngiae]|uniref:Acyl CoA:acetate/3-ketoacid CoA transferase n=1 Tax=Desulfosporosinus youngiae DSM 17734 TaxID=768710 RepID=H5Y3B3_9FIRM|nr:acyl CoA:acetate/3-ketoacid CoA transferase [Desulfosporosinus youngiae]EHQ88882.1 acyl CoA:acetate/3-ketoacid CoA transferase [Desulfosporosinus youngiae DSM 17734]
MAKVIDLKEVGNFVKDGDTIYITGFASGYAEDVMIAIEQSFLETGHPREITCYHPAIGNFNDRGLHQFAHEGMLKRVVAAHYKCTGPKVCKFVNENKFEAYNLPMGIIYTMSRNIAARRPGILTKVGLGTFVDPRVEGGKINQKARENEDLVEVVQFDNEEWLYYKLPKIDVTLIRGSVADENGNISFYREAIHVDWFSAAQAAKASGGIVIAQVETIVKAGTLHPKDVKVPGLVVDYLVLGKREHHYQTVLDYFSPVYNGDIKVPINSEILLEMDERKIIGRRAALELTLGAVVNLGIGMPEAVSAVAAEENVTRLLHLTTESGAIGGAPAPGLEFGHAINADAVIGSPNQFDFYDGGGLDVAFLGAAEIDRYGNVNVSKLKSAPIGCGGFINITQNAKKLVFCGTFTTGGLAVKIADGKLTIVQEGKNKKFIADVQQITFSGKYAASIGQRVLYVTERAVFLFTAEGLELIEIAPGVDLEKDILGLMDFKPIIKNVRMMPREIFQEVWGVLAETISPAQGNSLELASLS